MEAYVKEVLKNDESVTIAKTTDYVNHQKGTRVYMNAQPLEVENLEGINDMERAIYSYLKNQDIELLISEPKYSTALVNYPDYKAVCIELGLIGSEQSEERLCALSHELGHYLDVKFNHRGDAFRFNVVYNGSKENCVTMELVAWIYGLNILKALGYTNTKYFVTQMLNCLSTYVGNMERTAKICKNAFEIVSDYEEECKKVLSMIVE